MQLSQRREVIVVSLTYDYAFVVVVVVFSRRSTKSAGISQRKTGNKGTLDGRLGRVSFK